MQTDLESVIQNTVKLQWLKLLSDHGNLLKPLRVNHSIRSDANEDNLGDNCIKNCHLGRYIGGFTVGNFF